MALKNCHELSDVNIHCTCPEVKCLERQHLSSTHNLATMGYIEPKCLCMGHIEPKWAAICQKYICLKWK